METSCLRQSINTCFNQDFISHCSAWNRIYGTVFSVITGLNGSGQLRAVCGWVDLRRMTMQTRLPWPSTDASEWHWRSISIFPSFCAVCMEWRQTALGKGEVRCVCVCVCRVLAGVSDNEMQQGTKSWGPLFSVLQLHFHSRQSMILLNPLSCVHACMCVCVCVRACLCLYEPVVVMCTSLPSSSPPVSILHGRSP